MPIHLPTTVMPKSCKNPIGEYIKLKREAQKMTPLMLSKKSDIDERLLCKIESGEEKVDTTILIKLFKKGLGIKKKKADVKAAQLQIIDQIESFPNAEREKLVKGILSYLAGRYNEEDSTVIDLELWQRVREVEIVKGTPEQDFIDDIE